MITCEKSGTRSPEFVIARYRVTTKLGKGGMGEVWRATDTKLNREVAIKLLPELFARDADRMARFQREAQVLASLNHPNIAAIYGVEERALIMELVEGLTLAERIAQGPLPLEEALPIARSCQLKIGCGSTTGERTRTACCHRIRASIACRPVRKLPARSTSGRCSRATRTCRRWLAGRVSSPYCRQ